MTNVCIEFEKIDGVIPYDMKKRNICPGYEHINVHMIFDINMDRNFTRREILVTNGHITSPS